MSLFWICNSNTGRPFETLLFCYFFYWSDPSAPVCFSCRWFRIFTVVLNRYIGVCVQEDVRVYRIGSHDSLFHILSFCVDLLYRFSNYWNSWKTHTIHFIFGHSISRSFYSLASFLSLLLWSVRYLFPSNVCPCVRIFLLKMRWLLGFKL